MPHSERPNTPEDPTSDQYLMYRLEHDLYELFEEQQVLLDIVAQQQEQRSNESQRVVVTEPPARHSTPVPEENRIEAVPERAVAVPSKLLAIGELNEQTDTGKDTVPPLPPLPPPRCICNQRRNSRPFLDDIKGAKCTPPKRTGLGYDTPFPYPKRMAKTRERRALFIFTVVDNMMLQLQRCMSLAETGAPPMPKNSSSVTIVELDALTNEPVKRVNTSTGTVPKKPNVNPIEKVVKRSKREKGDKRLHKKAGKEAELLAIEIDLDCEFGMEHIEKFRANRIREDDHSVYRTSAARKRKRENTEQQQQMITSVGAADADGEVLANALASLTINEQTNNNVQLVKPQPQSMALIQPQSGWYGNGMANIETQQDTRPCTPEVTPFAMLPQALHANNFLNQMPSTSAQARALSMAMSMSVHPDSLRSSLTPSPSTIDICSSMSVYQQQQQLQYQQQQQQQQQQFFPISPLQTVPDRGFVSPITPLSFVQGQNVNGNIGMPPIRSINGNDLNAPTYDGCRLNYVQDIGPMSTEAPPAPTSVHCFSFALTNSSANPSAGNGNGNDMQSVRMDICDQEYSGNR